MGAIEVLDDHPADALGAAVYRGVQIDADLLDDRDTRVQQVDLDAAELVGPATRPVLITETDADPFDATGVARQRRAQPPPHMPGQRIRHGKSLGMKVDDQFAPRVSQSMAMPRILSRGIAPEKQIV
jgi:hypothetical protein